MRLSSIRYLSNYDKLNKSRFSSDYFGIANITSKDVAGAFRSVTKLPSDDIQSKYRPLIGPRKVVENEQIEADKVFGHVRLDCENIPKKHGQYDHSNEKQAIETVSIKQMFVPDKEVDEPPSEKGEHISKESIEDARKNPNYNEPYIISEVEPIKPLSYILKIFSVDDPLENAKKYRNEPPLTFLFHFGESPCSDHSCKTEIPENTALQKQKLSGKLLTSEGINEAILETSGELDRKPALAYDPKIDTISEEELSKPVPEGFEDAPPIPCAEDLKFDKSIEDQYSIKGEEEQSISAYSYIGEVRARRIEPTAKGLKHRLNQDKPLPFSSSIKLDSKGFKVYTNQVIDWSLVRRSDIVDYVRKSIIYNNYDIVAINKPYGISSHSEDGGVDMNNIVKEIGKQQKFNEVHLVHRLDKTTTGVLLFATSLSKARELHKLFKADQIKKSYWCITKGVPVIREAIIDMPLIEYKVRSRSRMVPIPHNADLNEELSEMCREASRAITEYKVLKSNKEAALVEVKPRSGVKHQIRCHMGFGLNRPILGDHKYSYIEKWAPQKLPLSLLKALNIRQQKVRTLPVHLHARGIAIPSAKANGQTLFISAPLPNHFRQNLKALGLMPQDVDL